MKTNHIVDIRVKPSSVRGPTKTKPLNVPAVRLGIWFCAIPILLICSLSHAQSLSILVSNAVCATYVEAQGNPSTIYPPTSRTRVSTVPISDEMDSIFSNYMVPGVYTNQEVANANYFGLSVSAGGVGGAAATNQIWFAPVMDKVQTLEIQISTFPASASGSVSLFDLTANSAVWNYFYNYENPYNSSNNIPWTNGVGNADFNFTTPFLASHQYKLTMATDCGASDDSSYSQVQLLGLNIVPSTTPLSIQVSNAQYTTYVEAQGYSVTPPTPQASRLEMSSFPLTDEIDMTNSISGLNSAISSANYFDVSTYAGWGFANAAVTNQIWFSPVSDQVQTLGIQLGFSYSPFYNFGSVSLFDLTANSELWNYYWNYSTNNISANFSASGIADLNLVTSFLANHHYLLTMTASSNAGDDSNEAQIQLTGLQVVTPMQLTGTTISNGTPWFVLNGLGSNTYTIQFSSNLVNWVSLSTNTEPSTGAMLLNDASPNKPQDKFYRAVPWPAGSAFLSATAGRISPPFTIANQSIYQSIQTVIPTNGGLATYSFNISNPGNYMVQALVNAPNDGANSIFLNIDADPQAPTMISDIFPFTSGFEKRTLSWRGNGADTNNQYVPKVFNLTYGAHQLVIRGREVNTQLKNISIVPYP